MRINGFVVHGAVTAAVFASGVGAVIAGGASGGVTLAGPQVLRLIQNAPAALSSYPSVKLTMKVHVSFDGHSQTVEETANMTPDGKTGSFDIHLPNGAGTLSALAINNTLYMRAAPQSVATTAFGKSWVGFTLPPGTPGSSAQAPTGSDALSYLQLMPGATGEPKRLGRDTIDGVRTTHYRVTIDIAKAEQSMPSSYHQASAGKLAQQGITTLPIDVWLDAQNHVRQEKLSVTAGHVHDSMQLRLSGSSTPVQVTAPPASDVKFVHTPSELVEDAIER